MELHLKCGFCWDQLCINMVDYRRLKKQMENLHSFLFLQQKYELGINHHIIDNFLLIQSILIQILCLKLKDQNNHDELFQIKKFSFF